MLLAKAEKSSQRFYSMSAQIKLERKQYYDILEDTQKVLSILRIGSYGSLNVYIEP